MELKQIPTDKILANFYQPREKFDKEKIQELAESILSNGLINPISIRKWKDKFMIVSGERRWRAHKVAGLKTIQAFVKEYKDEGQFMIESLIENIHREDLTSMEKAIFIKKIWKQMGKPVQERLAKVLSVEVSVIREHLSLIDEETPKIVQKAVKKGKLAMRSASMIKELPEEEQEDIASEALVSEEGIGRAEIERKISQHKQEKKRKIIEKIKKKEPIKVIDEKKKKEILKKCRELIVDTSNKQNKVVLFLSELDAKEILQELEWKDIESILSAGIESSEEYLKFLNKIYRRI